MTNNNLGNSDRVNNSLVFKTDKRSNPSNKLCCSAIKKTHQALQLVFAEWF